MNGTTKDGSVHDLSKGASCSVSTLDEGQNMEYDCDRSREGIDGELKNF